MPFNNKNILVIGGTGMLGRPVVRRLLKEIFDVHVLVRDPHRARLTLPTTTKKVPGDLQDVESIDAALDGCSAVYLSVDTPPRARFHPEIDGLTNVITAARNHPGVRLLLLSALGVSDPRALSHPWWHLREKAQAQQLAKVSGLAWTIFEPAWFMESLPLFCKKNTFLGFGKVDFNSHWISGDDYGRIIAAALQKNIGQERIVPAQGTEKISFKTAAEQFIQAYNPKIQIRNLPLWLLQALGIFNGQAKELATLLDLCAQFDEPAPDAAVWDAYAKPQMSIEGYASYLRQTADFPQK